MKRKSFFNFLIGGSTFVGLMLMVNVANADCSSWGVESVSVHWWSPFNGTVTKFCDCTITPEHYMSAECDSQPNE